MYLLQWLRTSSLTLYFLLIINWCMWYHFIFWGCLICVNSSFGGKWTKRGILSPSKSVKAMFWCRRFARVSTGMWIRRPGFWSYFFFTQLCNSASTLLSAQASVAFSGEQADGPDKIAEVLSSSDSCLWLHDSSWPPDKSESSLASLDTRSQEDTIWCYQKSFSPRGARKLLACTSQFSWWSAVNH